MKTTEDILRIVVPDGEPRFPRSMCIQVLRQLFDDVESRVEEVAQKNTIIMEVFGESEDGAEALANRFRFLGFSVPLLDELLILMCKIKVHENDDERIIEFADEANELWESVEYSNEWKPDFALLAN